jgi:hypothetical protein
MADKDGLAWGASLITPTEGCRDSLENKEETTPRSTEVNPNSNHNENYFAP